MPGRKDVFQNAMNRGHSAAWDQDWENAATYYHQAYQEFPDNPQALTSLALAYYQIQNFDEALQYYLKAAEVSTSDPVPREKASEIYERLGSIGLATENSFLAAELYARLRDMDKAIECWNRVTRLNPEHLLAHSGWRWCTTGWGTNGWRWRNTSPWPACCSTPANGKKRCSPCSGRSS